MPDLTGQAPPGGWPVVLDTDIGSDIDDLLALLLLAGDPRVELLAVTTVYGDVGLRARIASRVLRLLGREVPVHAGTAEPRSGAPVWWGGHEGGGLDGLDDEAVAPGGGVDALLDAARRRPGELVVVAVGPLTNLAEALDRDPAWAGLVRRLVIMGGEFTTGRPEHNVRCDTDAARRVLAAGVPSRWVGLDVTTTVWFDEADLDAVTASGTPLAALLGDQTRRWWRAREQPRTNPHDPLAVLALLEPALFAFGRGGWRVVEGGDRPGALAAAPGAAAIEHASMVDAAAAAAAIRRRLAEAAGADGTGRRLGGTVA